MLVWMQSARSSEENCLVVEERDATAVVVAFFVLTSASADDKFGLATARESNEDLANVDVGFTY